MDVPDQLRSLFSARIEEREETYVVEIPEREVRLGSITRGEPYRVAILPSDGESDGADTEPQRDHGPREPPVAEGEQRAVEIEDIGQQGDGIARVERGFVVIVPETERGERVTAEITDVRENVAFAEVVER